MKTRLRLLSLFALVLILFACGAAPESTESTETVAQPLLIPLVMHVQVGTLQMVSPKGRLSDSPTNPTPNLTLVTILSGATIMQYSTSARMAIVSVTAAQFSAINTMLATPGHTVDVHLTYDDSGTSTTKTVTAVSFTLV